MAANLVVIRAFGGRALVRRLAEANEEGVFVEGPDGLPAPTGFPWEDVFEYDSDVLTEDSEPVDWGRLRPKKPGVIG